MKTKRANRRGNQDYDRPSVCLSIRLFVCLSFSFSPKESSKKRSYTSTHTHSLRRESLLSLGFASALHLRNVFGSEGDLKLVLSVHSTQTTAAATESRCSSRLGVRSLEQSTSCWQCSVESRLSERQCSSPFATFFSTHRQSEGNRTGYSLFTFVSFSCCLQSVCVLQCKTHPVQSSEYKLWVTLWWLFQLSLQIQFDFERIYSRTDFYSFAVLRFVRAFRVIISSMFALNVTRQTT